MPTVSTRESIPDPAFYPVLVLPRYGLELPGEWVGGKAKFVAKTPFTVDEHESPHVRYVAKFLAECPLQGRYDLRPRDSMDIALAMKVYTSR
jgi:hypothetical protein